MVKHFLGLLCVLFMALGASGAMAQTSTSTLPCRTAASANAYYEKDGCVDARVQWEFIYNGTTRLYDSKYDAAQGYFALYKQNYPTTSYEAVQEAPITYTSTYNSCAHPDTITDNGYTTYRYGSDRKTFYLDLYGWRDVTRCGGDREYVTSGSSNMNVHAKISCPPNYRRYRSVIDDVNEPFGYVCVPSEPTQVLGPSCPGQSKHPEGGCYTGHPVNLSTRHKQETVSDLATNGPWPIVWSRSYTSASSAFWSFDQMKTFLTSITVAGDARGRFGGTLSDTISYKTTSAATPSGAGVAWAPNEGSTANLMVQSTITHSYSSGVFTYTLTDRSGIQERYQGGLLVERENQQGYKHFYAYDNAKRLTRIEDEFGHYIAIDYAQNIGRLPQTINLISYSGTHGTGQTTTPISTNYYPGDDLAEIGTRHKVQSVTDGSRTIQYTWGTETGSALTGVAFPLLSVIDSDGNSQTYLYDEYINGHGSAPSVLTGKIDGENRRTNTYDYSSSGSLLVYREWTGGDRYEVGAKETLALSGSTVTDQNGFSFSYVKNATTTKLASVSAKCPWCIPSMGDLKKSYTYDAAGNPTSMTDFNGNIETFTYDTQNRPLTHTEASGSPLARTTSFTYSGDRKSPDTIVEQVLVGGSLQNRTTSVTYNARNQPIQEDVSFGAETRSTFIGYNAQSLVESIVDAHTQTGFTYNSAGQVSAIVEGVGTALERTTTLSGYHANGQPTTITYPDGTQSTRSYSTMGRLLSETTQGQTTSYTYDLAGLLTSISYPDGTSDILAYSQSQKVETITHKDSSETVVYTTALTRDPMNQVVGTTITRGSTVDWSQTNVRNKLAKIQTLTDANSNQTSITYNAEGQPTLIAEPLGRSTTLGYDQLKRLKSQVLPNTGATSLSYGADDQVGVATDARTVQTNYTYNGFGELTQLASPDRGTWSYTYNHGRLDTITDPRGVVATYSYDALGRPVQVVRDTTGVPTANQAALYGGTQTQTLAYDACMTGKLCSIADNQGTTSFTYDTLGRLSTTSRSDVSLPSMSVGQTYDAAGRIATRTYPSGKVATYSYDVDGQLSGIDYDGQAVVANATYNALGQILTLSWGGAASLGQAFTYDQNGDVVQVDDPTTSIEIDRDALHRPTLFTDTGATTTQSHGYDAMSQVVSSEFSLWGSPKNYTYDLGGNLVSSLDTSNSGTTASVATGSNRLASTGTKLNGTTTATQAIIHDAMGSIVSTGLGDTITYDATGRLSEWDDGIDTTRMSYNAFGQRVKKIVTGVHPGVYQEAYDDEGRLIGVYTPNGSGGLDVVEELVYLDGWRTVATIRPDAVAGMTSPVIYPIVSDHLGSPRKILDMAGSVVWSWTNTEPYGNQTPYEMVSGSRFVFDGRFPGQRFDASTGALHNGFRTYSPRIGRYMQSDPLGLEAGWNTYGYVGGNPLSAIDVNGLIQKRFQPDGKPIKVCHGNACGTLQRGYLFTDKGRKFLAYKRISGDQGLAQNCHGFAFGVPYWVEDPNPVFEDEYHEVLENSDPDLVHFYEDGPSGRIPMHTSKMGSWLNSGKNGAYPSLPVDPYFIHSMHTPVYYKKNQ